MAGETVESVEQMYATGAHDDLSSVHDALWAHMSGLAARVMERFAVERDPSSEPFESYGDPAGARGLLRTYAGPEIDWLVHSWTGHPEAGFTNIHLTAWLGPHVRVPHLGMACGTLPTLWFFFDHLPRSDTWTDIAYNDRYYEPKNAAWLELKADPRLAWFTSRTFFIREAMSQTALCFSLEANDANVALVQDLATRHVEQWLGYLDDAPPVPESERGVLARRDYVMRRNIAELDPANVMGEKFFGAELTEKLVRMLWGGDRVLPRPGV